MSQTLKKSHAPIEDRTGDPLIYSLALYHVTIKAGLYRKAVQVYHILNLYPETLYSGNSYDGKYERLVCFTAEKLQLAFLPP